MAQKKESELLWLDNSTVKELIEAGVQRLVHENKSSDIDAALEILRCLAEWGVLEDRFRVLFDNRAQGV